MTLKRESFSSERNTGTRATIYSRSRTWFGYFAQAFTICYGVLWVATLQQRYTPFSSSHSTLYPEKNSQKYICRPPLPPFTDKVSLEDPLFRAASHSLHRYFQSRMSQTDIDSLAIAVVTSRGPVFQNGYGALKANETEPCKRGTVDENTIYRIASVTKMFNVLETVILRERGVLDWDDPVTKYFPNFVYNPYPWPEYASHPTESTLGILQEPITIRQLASHMSGLGRQYPPTAIEWPSHHEKTFQMGPNSWGETTIMPGDDGPPTKKQVLEAIAKLPLIAPPYTYPVYSNTGFDLLGWVNVEANAAAGNRSEEPDSFSTLLRRDVFEPVGMNSSSFSISPGIAQRVAVAARDNEDTDMDFTDSFNPSGGQYSSLSDLSIFMQTLLDPHKENAVLRPYAVREWLRPLHGWSDDLTEVGAPWEIIKYTDSAGQRQRFYQKGGNLISHHSQFSINPISSYGVIVLVAGRYTNTAQLVHEAIRRFQPVFDQLQESAAKKAYSGYWASDWHEGHNAKIRAEDGSLWIDKLVLNGTDVLALLQKRKIGKGKPMALWTTGSERAGEFRIAFGRPALNDEPLAGCEPYWITIDGIHANGAPIDLLYFETDKTTGRRVLRIPSAGANLERKNRGN